MSFLSSPSPFFLIIKGITNSDDVGDQVNNSSNTNKLENDEIVEFNLETLEKLINSKSSPEA